MYSILLFVALCQITFGFPLEKETSDNEVSGNETYPELYSGYFEGDIVLPKLTTRNGLLNTRYRWPNGVIPYIFQGSLSNAERSVIQQAMAQIQKTTCIRFVQRTTQRDYVSFANRRPGVCSSNVGKAGGAQQINLGRGCSYVGIAIHEIVHAIGFFHEQSRTDRDQFVTIMWQNIQSNARNNFNKYGSNIIGNFGQPYDYGSIMHYPRKAFSNNGRDTIVPKNSQAQIGQRSRLSAIDIAKIKRMYNCR